jgi:uncharacterized membrane protein
LYLTTISTYQIYLTVHILAAVVWVGGALMLQVFAIRAMAASRSGDVQRLAVLSGEAEWVGTRMFVPASLILVIFGFLLVHKYHWPFHLWLIFALVVWAASFLTGVAFLGPESGRLRRQLQRDGVENLAVQARIRRIFLVSRIELLFLILVVIDMALKPGS